MNLLKLLPRFRAAERNLARLAERESWSRAQIEQYQLEQINRLWKGAIDHSDYYRSLFHERTLPRRFDSLRQFAALMPILDRSYVRNHPERLLNRQRSGPGGWHRTGGSTGSPTRVYWNQTDHLRNLQTRYRWYQQWDMDFLDRETMLWGHAASFTPGFKGRVERLRQPLLDRLRSRQRLSAYQLGDRDLDEYLRHIVDFQPARIYGYSSALWLLSRRAATAGTSVASLKALIATGEPASPQMIQEVQHTFGCPVIREYGSVDCGIMAGDDRERNLRVREDAFFLETVPGANGMYEIVVTGLLNESFPLFRYSVGDLTAEPLEKPDHGFATLSTICGRNNDFVVARSGRLIHSNGVKHVFERLDQVRRFRVLQHADGSVTASLEIGEQDPDSIEIGDSQQRLQQLLEGSDVTIDLVATLPGNRAGKHRWVVSELFQSQNNASREIAEPTVVRTQNGIRQ